MLISGIVLPLIVAAVSGVGALLVKMTIQVRADEALERRVTFFRAEEEVAETAMEGEFARCQRIRYQGAIRARQQVSASAYPMLAIFMLTSVAYGWGFGRGLVESAGWWGGAFGYIVSFLSTWPVAGAAHSLLATRKTIYERRRASSSVTGRYPMTGQIRPLNQLGLWNRLDAVGAVILSAAVSALGLALGLAMSPAAAAAPSWWVEIAVLPGIIAGVLGVAAIALLLILWTLPTEGSPADSPRVWTNSETAVPETAALIMRATRP